MSPRVSVIIPAYNVASYISETLDSVIAQTFSDMEIIIVNDGSTDTTPNIIESYAARDPRIRIIHQENRGLAGARNTGLRSAVGDYLCIFDSDDIMMPDKIAVQVSYLDAHPACGLVYTDCYHFIDGTNRVRTVLEPDLSKENAYEILLHGNHLNPNVVMFRKSVYESLGGFDETLRSAEDWEYWLKFAHAGVNFGHVNQPLTRYRVRSNSLSGDGVVMYQTAIRVLEKQYDKAVTQKQLQLIRQGIAARYKKLLVAYLVQGKRKEAWKLVMRRPTRFMLFAVFSMVPTQLLRKGYTLLRRMRFMLRSRSVTSR